MAQSETLGTDRRAGSERGLIDAVVDRGVRGEFRGRCGGWRGDGSAGRSGGGAAVVG